ncbi:M64 family metallopeptidase [Marinovum sp.]|uniref:M64 family metallopeptidase n=1 Tax=Marinovum sp. TaxID=2024839 RepID=UPI003A91DB1F
MPVTTVTNAGPSDNRVDIIMMGDGYTQAQIPGTYYDHIDDLLAYLFSGDPLTEPFNRYSSFFNVHAVEVVSNESGADIPPGTMVDTALNSSYFFDGVTERLLYPDDALSDAALAAGLAGTGIDPEIRFVLVNSDKYGGGGGHYAAFAAGNSDAMEVAVHELGHSFVDLADEYGGSGAAPGSEPSEANVTLDSTGAKWARWHGYDDGILGPIGAFEGGLYTDTGVWRPTDSSKMRDLNRPFDAIAREAFVLKFYDLVDPLDDFSHAGGSLSVTDPGALLLAPVDPALFSVEWRLAGVTLGETSAILDFDSLVLATGSYTVTAIISDTTDWVRLDRSSLSQTVTWQVEITDTPGLFTTDGTVAGEMIRGSGGNDFFTPGAGSDVVDGEGGIDAVSYVDLAQGVTVNLLARTAVSAGETDTLRSIENVTGSIFGDFIRGDDGANRIRGLGDYDWLVGSGGADYFDGGTGRDMISYVYAGSGVTVDLGAGRGTAGQAAGDRYVSIERVTGSIYDDLFSGASGEEDFRGLGGYDWFVGSAGGKDRYDGGSGRDTVAYSAASAAVEASLLLGRGIGGDAARDLYTSIENLTGSSFDDALTGDNGRNVLRGLYGEDTLLGNGGVDYLTGGGNDDVLDGGSGWDVAVFERSRGDYDITTAGAVTTVSARYGGEGTDTLNNIEALQFADEMVFL